MSGKALPVRQLVEACVRVHPRYAGDFGSCWISGIRRSDEEEIKLCEQIGDQIKRHVDDVGSVYVTTEYETVCSNCGLRYEVDEDENGKFTACCGEAVDAEGGDA